MLQLEHLKCNVLKRVAVATLTKEKKRKKQQQKQNRKQNVQWQICHAYL
jgi:hypothetical protein